MKDSIGNFLLEDWTPTPFEQALKDGTSDEFLAESVEMDKEEIPDDFLKVQDFDTAMEELKAELDDDISASETFAERFEHLSPEEVSEMYRVYMLTPYAVCYDSSLLLQREYDSFIYAPMRLPLEELLKTLKWRYRLSEQQIVISEVQERGRIHVLAADDSAGIQGEGKDNLAVINEEMAQWGYSVRDVDDRMTFHNVPFIHIVLEPQDKH